MKHQDEYRNPQLVKNLADAIAGKAARLSDTVRFMEVCGTHTMAIARFGLKSLLPEQVQLVSGPGCPVCVTPQSYIDQAIALASCHNVVIATFGDMLKVPGTSSSLMLERAKGADIRIIQSPLDALEISEQQPDREIALLGIGFETTAPTVAATIITASQQKLANFSVLAAHKTMPAPMSALAADPLAKIKGYICPAHVSTVIGGDGYRHLVDNHAMPCVITGFEPADIMQGILWLLHQHINKSARVEIQYSRAVTWDGNKKAQSLLQEVFIPCDAQWRGLGVLPDSGLAIRKEYADFDAAVKLPVSVKATVEPVGCRCGDVLTGRIFPMECPLFGKACQPEKPVGACMVSSEGSCAAAWRYQQS